MIFETHFKPELTASKDETRPHLNHVFLDVEKRHMASTDGHRMVLVPCEPEEGDVSGWITKDALEAARKAAKKFGAPCQIKANGHLDIPGGMQLQRPSLEDTCQPPPYDKVKPDYSDGQGTYTIAFNAKYIAEIAKALGAKNDSVRITMRGPLDPILIEASEGGSAVLMPCRL